MVQFRVVYLAPPALLLACLLSMYVVASKLAADVQAAHVQEQAGGAMSETPLVLSLPRTFDDARQLSLALSTHLSSQPQSATLVVLLFAATYILKQSFSIPGSALLNIMAGFVFGTFAGVPMVAFLTALGASGCYMLSGLVGHDLLSLAPFLQARVSSFEAVLRDQQASGTLFRYLLVLRVFPMTPNWLVNLTSPLVGVPLTTFFLTALIGLTPYVYVTVTAGDTLRTLTMRNPADAANMSFADIMDSATMIKLGLLSVALLIPNLIGKFTNNKAPKQA